MKAKCTFKDGFRFYRLDNVAVDLKPGDTFEADDMSPRDREARLAEKHIEFVDEKPAPHEKASKK